MQHDAATSWYQLIKFCTKIDLLGDSETTAELHIVEPPLTAVYSRQSVQPGANTTAEGCTSWAMSCPSLGRPSENKLELGTGGHRMLHPSQHVLELFISSYMSLCTAESVEGTSFFFSSIGASTMPVTGTHTEGVEVPQTTFEELAPALFAGKDSKANTQ